MAQRPGREHEVWLGALASRAQRRRRLVVGLLGLALVAAAGTGGWVWSRYHDDWGFKAVIDAAAPGCQPSVRRFGGHDRKGYWPDATRYSIAYCGGELALGPTVIKARFRTLAEEQRDLLAQPPSDRVCLDGTVVYDDGLDPNEFPRLCRKVGGHLVDEVTGLPEISEASSGPTPTQDSIDHAVAVEESRDSALQKRALAAYFAHR